MVKNTGFHFFQTFTKQEVIYAFLINKMNPTLQRYMYIVADEFIEQFKEKLKEFKGIIGKVSSFEDAVSLYFSI